ncbi:hypothetical protein Syun_001894 [Stephania yunnanensis]|uniref:Uncharacterized protein n=1 Tax=Stephania yunnanensis TaxID=152371 RepID=A0AAP0LIR7_9MAGN
MLGSQIQNDRGSLTPELLDPELFEEFVIARKLVDQRCCSWNDGGNLDRHSVLLAHFDRVLLKDHRREFVSFCTFGSLVQRCQSIRGVVKSVGIAIFVKHVTMGVDQLLQLNDDREHDLVAITDAISFMVQLIKLIFFENLKDYIYNASMGYFFLIKGPYHFVVNLFANWISPTPSCAGEWILLVTSAPFFSFLVDSDSNHWVLSMDVTRVVARMSTFFAVAFGLLMVANVLSPSFTRFLWILAWYVQPLQHQLGSLALAFRCCGGPPILVGMHVSGGCIEAAIAVFDVIIWSNLICRVSCCLHLALWRWCTFDHLLGGEVIAASHSFTDYEARMDLGMVTCNIHWVYTVSELLLLHSFSIRHLKDKVVV